MRRIFIFSYKGRGTHETSFNRLLSISENLSKYFEVYFIYGSEHDFKKEEKKKKIFEIPIVFKKGIIQKTYAFLQKRNAYAAKLFFILHYCFTRKEVLDFKENAFLYFQKEKVEFGKNDIIFATHPTLSVQSLGSELKKKYGSKLILEYRDPGVFGYKLIFEKAWMAKARKIFLKNKEQRNLERADLIITISQSLKNFFPEKYHRKIHIIKNGFDSKLISYEKIANSKEQFILTYLGTIYDEQLSDHTFFVALRKFIDKYAIGPQHFKLRFIGSADSIRLKKVIEHFELDNYCNISAKMEIEKIYSNLYDTSMFLHLRYGERREIITSKQYEYLAFQKPILLPVNDHGDLEESIKKYDAGFVCNSENEIIDVLKMSIDNHFNGNPKRIGRTEEELYDLSRQGQEEKLLKLINQL
mgnify:CR=1 FL=1